MRCYDKDFKVNAVNLYKASGHSLQVMAKELGISTSMLGEWVKVYSREGDKSFPGKGQVKSPEAEIRDLKRELLHVQQERDILKKAVAIFSSPQGKGINS